MLFKLSNLNSNLALTLGYLNPALNNSALEICLTEVVRTMFLKSLVGTSPSTILSLVLRNSSKNLCES